jgi:tRNA threonylcarbamoyladenosine biosynthesis protein TsaB
MNILALDTSMGACSAAVLRADGGARVLHLREEVMERGHAEALIPMVAEVMEEADLSFEALDVIAATVGPGSFTGVRISIAAARGFALMVPVKFYGTDSLTVMARAAYVAGVTLRAPFAVAVDARRGMLYLGLYDETGRKLDGPILVAPDEAVALLPPALKVAVGSGAALLAEVAAQHGKHIEAALPELQPSAGVLAEIAFEAGETVPILRPLYLRPPDAKPQVQTVARR